MTLFDHIKRISRAAVWELRKLIPPAEVETPRPDVDWRKWNQIAIRVDRLGLPLFFINGQNVNAWPDLCQQLTRFMAENGELAAFVALSRDWMEQGIRVQAREEMPRRPTWPTAREPTPRTTPRKYFVVDVDGLLQPGPLPVDFPLKPGEALTAHVKQRQLPSPHFVTSDVSIIESVD